MLHTMKSWMKTVVTIKKHKVQDIYPDIIRYSNLEEGD